jgi:hypothetical protein
MDSPIESGSVDYRKEEKHTHVKGIVKIEVVMSVEVTTDELVNLCFAGGMEILELVHSLELDDIETVRKNAIRLSLEKMLALVGGDMRNGGENVRTVRRGTFDAISVVNSAFARFVVHVKVLQIVVKVDGTRTQIASKKSSVRGEDGGDVDVSLPAEGDRKACLPFVEVGDNRCGRLSGNVLDGNVRALRDHRGSRAYISQEPGDEVSQDDRLVGFLVTWGTRNTSQVPEVRLPLVEFVVHAAGVEEQNMGVALDEPSSIENLYALSTHSVNGASQMLVCRFLCLDLHGGCLVGQRAD